MITIAQSKQFYKSKAWEQCREFILDRDAYLCQECSTSSKPIPADTVHHKEHLRDHWERRFDPSNLISVCSTCHNKLHPEKSKGRKSEKVERNIPVVTVKKNPEIF